MGEKPVEMTPSGGDPSEQLPSSDDAAQIRADIEQTRAEMSETIDAIQEKLSPQRIMEQAKDTVREATVGKVEHMVTSATETASELANHVQDGAQEAVRYVRDNPLPAGLVGAGVAWLLMRGRGEAVAPGGLPSSRPRSYGSRYSSRPEGWMDVARQHPIPTILTGLGVGWMLMKRGTGGGAATGVRTASGPSTASTWTHGVQETARDVARDARQTVGAAAEQVQEGWQQYSTRAESEFDRWMRENPLTVGAAAIAVGAAVGLGVPRTRTEDAWLGEARDTLVEQAQEAAQETVQQARSAMGEAGQSGPSSSEG